MSLYCQCHWLVGGLSLQGQQALFETLFVHRHPCGRYFGPHLIDRLWLAASSYFKMKVRPMELMYIRVACFVTGGSLSVTFWTGYVSGLRDNGINVYTF